MAWRGLSSSRSPAWGDAPWGHRRGATEFEAAGPEVLARFRRQFNWCATHGCAFLAVVAIGDFKRYLADHVFQRFPFQEVRYFEETQAIHWLTQRLEGLQKGKEIHVSTG